MLKPLYYMQSDRHVLTGTATSQAALTQKARKTTLNWIYGNRTLGSQDLARLLERKILTSLHFTVTGRSRHRYEKPASWVCQHSAAHMIPIKSYAPGCARQTTSRRAATHQRDTRHARGWNSGCRSSQVEDRSYLVTRQRLFRSCRPLPTATAIGDRTMSRKSGEASRDSSSTQSPLHMHKHV